MILFLDFDGVLHPQEHGGKIFSCLPLLWQILLACPAVEVVFSTSWREHYPLDALTAFVTSNGGERLVQRFIGTTPVHPWDPDGSYRHREKECLAWLSASAHTGPWLAIDDIAGWFSRPCPNLYLVDDRTGLTSSDVPLIIQRLA